MTTSISRRNYLSTLVATGAWALAGCASVGERPKTYVLVHGAWHGNWAWESVIPLLEKPNVRVFAPTLTGLAERVSENGPNVTLDTHINDVVALLDKHQLTDEILVGHSYGGFVVTGVCDQRPERIAHVVYLDAFVPESGQKVYNYVKPAERVEQSRAETREKGQGFKAFPPNAANWGLTGAMMEEVNRRMTPHPAMTNEQPLILKRGGPYAVPKRTYIDCTRPAMRPFVETKTKIKSDVRWSYLTVAAGHEVSLTHPKLLAAILEGIS